MTTTVSLDDIDQLSKEVELGAVSRDRENSMESSTSSRPLAKNSTSVSTQRFQGLMGFLVMVLFILVIVLFVRDHRENDHDHEENEVILSTSSSISGYENVGALYEGQGEWVDKLNTPEPVDGRSDLQVVKCGDSGKMYLLGGASSDSTVQDLNLEFDPSFETYTVKAPMPTPRMRFGAACSDGIIYVTGGFPDVTASNNGESIATMDAYDVATNTWTTGLAEMPAPRGDIAFAAVDGKLYAFGGYGFQYAPADTVTEIYDIDSNTWSSGADIPSRRGDAVAVSIGTDIYVLGGWIDNYPLFNPSTAAEKYDTLTGEWVQLADMLVARGDCGVAVLGNKLYVVGGETSALDENGDYVYQVPIHDVEHYDLENDIWVRMAPIPSPRFRFAAASSEDAIYAFGGHAQNVMTVNTVQAFYYLDRPNVFLHSEIHD